MYNFNLIKHKMYKLNSAVWLMIVHLTNSINLNQLVLVHLFWNSFLKFLRRHYIFSHHALMQWKFNKYLKITKIKIPLPSMYTSTILHHFPATTYIHSKNLATKITYANGYFAISKDQCKKRWGNIGNILQRPMQYLSRLLNHTSRFILLTLTFVITTQLRNPNPKLIPKSTIKSTNRNRNSPLSHNNTFLHTDFITRF